MNVLSPPLSRILTEARAHEAGWQDVHLPRRRRTILRRLRALGGVEVQNASGSARNQLGRALATRSREPLIARIREGRVEAFLSPRHTNLSHSAVLEALIASRLGRDALVRQRRFSGGGATMRLQLLLPDTLDLDDGQLGVVVQVQNGLLGHDALRIEVGLLRLVCRNGLLSLSRQARQSWVHRGPTREAFEGIDAMAIASTHLYDIVDRARLTPTDVLEGLRELYRHGLLSAFVTRQAAALIDEAPARMPVRGARTTLWGLVNAISAVGRDSLMDKSQRLQRIAGRLAADGLDATLGDRPVVITKVDSCLRELDKIETRWAGGGPSFKVPRQIERP